MYAAQEVECRKTINRIVSHCGKVEYTAEDTTDPKDIVYLQIERPTPISFQAIRKICTKLKRLSVKCYVTELQNLKQMLEMLRLEVRLQIQWQEDLIELSNQLEEVLLQVSKAHSVESLTLYHCGQAICINQEYFKGLASGLPQLQILEILGDWNLTAEGVRELKRLKHLRGLTLDRVNLLPKEITKTIIEHLSDLKQLKIHLEDPQSLMSISHLKDLERVQIYYKQSDKSILTEVLGSLPQLQDVQMADVTISQPELSILCQKWQRVRKVGLLRCNIDDSKLTTLALKLKNLEELLLGFNKPISAHGLGTLVNKHQTLKILDLTLCSNITDAAAILISNNLRRLEVLQLYVCHLTNKGLTYLRRLKQLKRLNVMLNWLSCRTLWGLLINLRNLRQLCADLDSMTPPFRRNYKQIYKFYNHLSYQFK